MNSHSLDYTNIFSRFFLLSHPLIKYRRLSGLRRSLKPIQGVLEFSQVNIVHILGESPYFIIMSYKLGLGCVGRHSCMIRFYPTANVFGSLTGVQAN